MSKIKVTFRTKDNDFVKEYQSPKVAYKAIFNYLNGKDTDPFNMVIYYDPETLPVTFHKAEDVPYNPIKKKSKAVDFYNSHAWVKLRLEALDFYGRRCVLCGATGKLGAILHVDHIKPRSKYPELALDLDNLQILCSHCNKGKSNNYEDDWR